MVNYVTHHTLLFYVSRNADAAPPGRNDLTHPRHDGRHGARQHGRHGAGQQHGHADRFYEFTDSDGRINAT